MNKYFLICFSLFTLSLSFYRPFSKLNISYPSDMCYFKDTTSDSAISNLEFVRGCKKNEECIEVDNRNSYVIKTCQNQDGITKSSCSNNFECTSPKICIQHECCPTGGCPSTTPDVNPTQCEANQIYNHKSGASPVCDPNREQNKKYCKIYNSDGSEIADYQEENYAKICGKNTIESTGEENHYYRKSTEWVYYGSVEDNKFVEQVEACKSGYALYFYGNNGLTNPLDGSHEMFLLCVTVLDVELENTIGTPSQRKCQRIKYKIGSGNELIYDTSNLDSSYTLSNCDYLLMTKLELFKKYKEEYDKVKDQCYSSKSSDNLCGKDELMKWWYLYEHPRDYLLYKDQTEVLDYLIHETYSEYTPETGKVPETTPVTEPAAITEETTTEPETESSKFLNIKYFIFLLFGLFEL